MKIYQVILDDYGMVTLDKTYLDASKATLRVHKKNKREISHLQWKVRVIKVSK